MEVIGTYFILFGIIILVGVLFGKSPVPIALLLVLTGMFLSFIPNFPRIVLKPDVVLNIFFPLMLYQISVFSSWRDFRNNFRPILLQSVGHVIFITVLVAVIGHHLIPEISWPLAFLLGAVISPPDTVAIVSIAKKIRMPRKIVTILRGEGVFNDATALILFRFSLAAVITHEFHPLKAFTAFCLVVIGETLYGLVLGNVIGMLRERIREPVLQMLVSLLTPFLAYLPVADLGGSGVLATVVTGLVIGNVYSERYSPEVRLLSSSIWSTIGFTVENSLFLLVGLNVHFIAERISSIPMHDLVLYGAIVTGVVMIGRFLWVFPSYYLPRRIFPALNNKDPSLPWQYSFLMSWAGMRGGISLAAALAVPYLPATLAGNVSPRDLLVFLVFCVIVATLILQGLALPWILKRLGIHIHGQLEKHEDVMSELSARYRMAKAVLLWLREYKEQIKNEPKLLEEVTFRIRAYKKLKRQLRERIKCDKDNIFPDETAMLKESLYVSTQIVEIERKALLQLWHNEQITYAITNRLLQQLDHRSKYLSD